VFQISGTELQRANPGGACKPPGVSIAAVVREHCLVEQGTLSLRLVTNFVGPPSRRRRVTRFEWFGIGCNQALSVDKLIHSECRHNAAQARLKLSLAVRSISKRGISVDWTPQIDISLFVGL
jgi:hypothetical protein